MLRDSQTVKQDVVLRAYAEAPSNLVHVIENVISIDGGCTTGGGVES